MSEIKLLQGNCLELIKKLPDNTISCIITDPPYDMSHSTGGCTNSKLKNRWRGNIKAGNNVMDFATSIKFSDWLPEVYRVLQESGHCYIFCNDKNMKELLNECDKVGFKESNILVWIKNNACPNRYYMKNCEFVLFLYKGAAKPINNMGDKAAVQVDNISGKNKLHPTQKPIGLLERFVLNSTNKNDIVLDLFMGSGSTGVAAVNTNRNFIGMELDEKYFQIAQNRIMKTNVENAWVECKCCQCDTKNIGEEIL